MTHIRIATGNAGKLREFKQMLEPLGHTVEGIDDLPDFDPIEDGDSFAANAIIKARALVERTGVAAVSDDSGLVVDALQGRPGIYSARYADESDPEFEGAANEADRGTTGDPKPQQRDRRFRDDANCRKLLRELEQVPPAERTARFECALAYCAPGAEPVIFRGTFEGSIGTQAQGANGFGYDPLFIVEGDSRSSAQLSSDEKNAKSHRGQALRAFVAWLEG